MQVDRWREPVEPRSLAGPSHANQNWRGAVLRIIAGTIFLFTIAFTTPSLGTSSQSKNQNSYRIVPGDKLTITVFGHEALSGPYTVDDEGYVQLPIGGALRVNGLTLRETQHRLKSRWADGYLVDPQVSIRIAELRPVFIIGSVNRPGSFPFRFGMTVAEVVALAGGFGSAAQNTTSSLPDLIAAKERLALLQQNRRDLLIRLARTEAEFLRNDDFDLPPQLISDADPRVFPMVANQQALLLQHRENYQRSLDLITKQRPRIETEFVELRNERKAAERKFNLARDYAKIQEKLKAKGYARNLTVLNAHTAVADYEASIARIDQRLSSLSQSLGDLDLQLQKEEEERMQRISREKQSVLAKLNEVEISIPLAERVLELRQNEVGGDVYSNQNVVYTIELISTTNTKSEQPQVDLLDGVSPGDILDVRVSMPSVVSGVSSVKASDIQISRSSAASLRFR